MQGLHGRGGPGFEGQRRTECRVLLGQGLTGKDAKPHLWVFLRAFRTSVLRTQILGVDPPNSDSFGGAGGLGRAGLCILNTYSDPADAGGPRPTLGTTRPCCDQRGDVRGSGAREEGGEQHLPQSSRMKPGAALAQHVPRGGLSRSFPAPCGNGNLHARPLGSCTRSRPCPRSFQ